MYIKFNLKEMDVKIPTIWYGRIVHLVAPPQIIDVLPPHTKSQTFVRKNNGCTSLQEYEFYYNCHHVNYETIQLALKLFNGPALCKLPEGRGFYFDRDNNLDENIFNGRNVIPANDKNAYIQQFKSALTLACHHRHHHPFNTFFQRVKQERRPSESVMTMAASKRF